jgi:D-alanyl-D-alanine carboxypeptidase
LTCRFCKGIFTAVIVPILLTGFGIPAVAAARQEYAAQPPHTSAASDILIEASSKTVLHEKNADKHMLIASTTKILTALVVLENSDVNDNVVIGNDFPAIEGSSIYLKTGEELTVLELLYGLLLESGNDAAVALALHLSGSLDAFSDLMNQYAKSIGCRDSHFSNPHGLDQKDHYSTARDLALISAEAMKNKTFRDIVSTKHIAIAGRYFRNHNKLLWRYRGAIGIKTGYTESAGRSLVSCAERDGMQLICVTLSAPDDWNDHSKLYNWAFGNYGCIKVSKEDQTYGNVPVISGKKEYACIHPAEDYSYVYARSDEAELSCELKKFVYAPVAEKEAAGLLTIRQNGRTVKEIPLIFGEHVELDETIPLTFTEKLKRLFALRK